MKQKLKMLKRIFYRFSRSYILNYLIFFFLILGMIFNLYSITIYKVLCILFWLEIMFLNVNQDIDKL